jgi:putative acetyltransferase
MDPEIAAMAGNNSGEPPSTSPKEHSKGVGYTAWCEVEKLHPEVKVWETVTPYFGHDTTHGKGFLGKSEMLKFREMTETDNETIAALVRDNLKQFGLDIPGTVYFDEGLDHLSDYYGDEERRYFVVEDEPGKVIGGIGFARFESMKDTAELQKLYLTDSAKGSGMGYEMIEFIENKMREAGYRQSYLETHENLQAAIHIYEKSGYKKIERPKEVVHSTMNIFFLKRLSHMSA